MNDGFTYALSLLARQSYTEAKLRRKLIERGFREDLNEIIQALKDKHFIDDELYSKRFIELKDDTMPSSEYLLRRKLKEKGVKEHDLNNAFARATRDELSLALYALQKKFKMYEPDKEKAMRFLASRGFSYSTVKEAYARFISDRTIDK